MKSNAFHWYQSLTIQNQTITINSDFQPKSTRITISFKLIFDLRKPKIRCEIDLIAKGIGAFTWDAFRKRRDSWLGPWWMELREKVGQIRLVDSDSPSWIRNEDLRDFLDLRKKGERESVCLCLCLCLCVSKHSSSIGDYMSAFARVLYLFFPVWKRETKIKLTNISFSFFLSFLHFDCITWCGEMG